MIKVWKSEASKSVFIQGVTFCPSDDFTYSRNGDLFTLDRASTEITEISNLQYTEFGNEAGTGFASANDFEAYLQGFSIDTFVTNPITAIVNSVLRWDGSKFIACLHQIIRSSALVINNTLVPQDKINVNVNVQRLVPHKITVSYQWSLNDGGQDFVSIASFGGAKLQESLTIDELHRQEPKDTAGADPDGRGTNQKYSFHKTYFVTPTSAGNNTLILQFAGSANFDLASMWGACIEVEELVTVTGT